MAAGQGASVAALVPATPRYELRVCANRPGDAEYEVWQLPSPATPQVTAPTRVAGLRGRNLELVEHRVLRKLAQSGIRLGGGNGRRGQGGAGARALTEDLALTLGLLFRCLAPMRNRENMKSEGTWPGCAAKRSASALNDTFSSAQMAS